MTAKFTNSGEFRLVDALHTGVTATVWAISAGSGTATDLKADDDLGAEATETRVSATYEGEGEGPAASDVFEARAVWTASTGRDIEEAALYWDSTGTTSKMMIRGTHTTVTVVASDQIEYTFTLEMT